MVEFDIKDWLLSGAYQIRDEQNMNGNTAARVGQMFVDIINAMGIGNLDADKIEILIDLKSYLKTEDAKKTFLTIVDAINTYLSKEDAANTYLSKVQQDTANELIRFLKGIAFGNDAYGIDWDGTGTLNDVSGNTIHSPQNVHDLMTGKGWDVDSDGNMQVESLEVRSALRVLELVYNRLSAEESEYVFTESGSIKELEPLGGNRYKLIMEKRGDTDFHAFRKGDVLRGIVNNLANLGERGEYYTTWLHVESTDAQGDNSMVVSMYADSECPSGRNYAPTKMMVVQRWGNSIPATKENHDNPEYSAIIDIHEGKYYNRRQSCWYLSSNEKRIAMLDGVTQPKLSQGNYAAFFGLPNDITDISGHSLNPLQPYLYARGAFIQDLHFIDYKGNVIRIERFRGEWSAEIAGGLDPYVSNSNTFDTVYHNNAKWECVAEQASEDEPSDTNEDWKLLQSAVEGESTPQYTLIPSVAVVQRDADGVPDVSIVTCKVRKTVGDDTTTEITDRLFYSINGGNPIQGSSVTLAKDDGIEKITFMLIPNNVVPMGVAKFGESKFQITKIEAIVDVLNKAQRGAILRGPSEWKADIEYMGGARGEEYQDMVVRTIDGVTEYFLCRYTHKGVDPHNASHQANSNWSVERPWQKSQVSDFVATRILYSEQIKADIMDVVNASIDELVVGRLQTMAQGGATISIQEGLMQVYGSAGAKNIEFGVDSDGYAVLKYFDMDGNPLYNLGPDGIMEQFRIVYARYVALNWMPCASNTQSTAARFGMDENGKRTVYKWYEGTKTIGAMVHYHDCSNTSIQGKNIVARPEHYENDGKLMTTKSQETSNPSVMPTNLVADGIYFRWLQHSGSEDYQKYTTNEMYVIENAGTKQTMYVVKVYYDTLNTFFLVDKNDNIVTSNSIEYYLTSNGYKR